MWGLYAHLKKKNKNKIKQWMSNRPTKAQLAEALQQAQVQIPASATLAQLRSLYEQEISATYDTEATDATATSVEGIGSSAAVPLATSANTSTSVATEATANAAKLTTPPADIAAQPSASETSTYNDEEEERELARLERRKRIMELQRELAGIELNAPSPSTRR